MVFVYCMPGWGKTRSMRTLDSPLILSTESGETQGLMTLRSVDLPFIEIRSWDELFLVLQELRQKKGKIGDVQYESLGLDSLSGALALGMDKGMKVLGWDEMFVAKGGDKHSIRIYQYIAEKGFQLYKALAELVKHGNMHVYATARESIAEEGSGDEKITYAVPNFPGQKLNRELPGEFEASLYGVTINGKRVLRTQAVGKVISRIRVPDGLTVPQYITPDIGKLLRAITAPDLTVMQQLYNELDATAKPKAAQR
jgi:hypothetical protein